MSFKQLPKRNFVEEQRETMLIKLESVVFKTIENFEKENNHEFYVYELDNMFLKYVVRHHQHYIRSLYKKLDKENEKRSRNTSAD